MPFICPIRNWPCAASCIGPDERRFQNCAHPLRRAREKAEQIMDLKELVGSTAAVMVAFMEDETYRTSRTFPVPIAMTVASNCVKDMTLRSLYEMVYTDIVDAYENYTLINGDHADIDDRAQRDDWESGIDDAIEHVFTPYERMVTANWFGVHTIDTRLHQAVEEGRDPEAVVLAKSFAADAWRVMTYVPPEDEDEKPRQMTATEILNAVGVSRSDIEDLLRERPTPTAETEKAHTMKNLYTTLNDIHEHLTMGGQLDLPDGPTLSGLIDNAIDSDDGMAISGMSQLGGDMADVVAFRTYAATVIDPVVSLVNMLCGAPYDVAAPEYGTSPFISEGGLAELQEANAINTAKLQAKAGAVETDDEAAELAAMMGLAPISAPPTTGSAGGFVPPPPPPAGVNIGAAPPKATRGGKKGETPEGALPPTFFQLVREHVNAKDEVVGGAIGVSRQTFINYGKPTAKAQFVPTPDQAETLRNMLTLQRDGLNTALAILDDATTQSA